MAVGHSAIASFLLEKEAFVTRLRMEMCSSGFFPPQEAVFFILLQTRRTSRVSLHRNACWKNGSKLRWCFSHLFTSDDVDLREMLGEQFTYEAVFLVTLSQIQSDLMKAAEVGIGANSSMRGIPLPVRTLVQNWW